MEIEKKFLLKNNSWRHQVSTSTVFKQGYFGGSGKASLRVRIEGDKANLNIKGATIGVVRQEYEYPIPFSEAEELLMSLCEQPLIEKVRHIVHSATHKWEIDEFKGDNSGLIVAEVELQSEDEIIELPDWVGKEVSAEEKYYNVALQTNPYKNWK